MSPPKLNQKNQVQQPRQQQLEQLPVQNRQGLSMCSYFLIALGIYFALNIVMPMINAPGREQIKAMIRSNPYAVSNCLEKGDKLNVSYSIAYFNKIIFQGSQVVQYSDEYQPISTNISLKLPQLPLKQNLTIQVQTSVLNSTKFPRGYSIQYINQNFTKYKTLRKQSGKVMEDPSIPTKNAHYETKIPEIFNIMLLYSQQFYGDMRQFQAVTKQLPRMDLFEYKDRHYYSLPIDASQLHTTNKHYHLPHEIQNITLNIYSYSFYKYVMVVGLTKPELSQQAIPIAAELYSDDSMNELKQILFENNIILIIVSFTLSVLQSIFQFLAVKNDIKIWKNISKYKGLSLKVLYTDLIVSIVFLMYYLDNTTTKLLIYFEVINIFVTIWKIFKTTEFIRKNTFPYFSMSYPKWYQSDIKTHDTNAIHYLYYILIPLFLIYTLYKLLVEASYASLYSFILESIVGFVYIFGFIQMTPQLYINYKLKSVAHLPWRSLIYKFINTIIDDLFAFMVTMPWLRRLSCFRDDIIFLVYIYQRAIYRTDYSRTATIDDRQQQQTDAEIKKE